MAAHGVDYWDAWWTQRLAESRTSDLFPGFPALISRVWPRLSNVVHNDDLLAVVMRDHGLRTVLCAGNGVSQEPRALARAGFDVTALDLSPVATRVAEASAEDAERLDHICSAPTHRPGGRAEFVAGDLLDPTVCPGPFDVVIERRTVQRFAEHERDAVLSALAGRLGDAGIFLSFCFDDPFPTALGWSQHPSGFFHASEPWFRAHGWTIWDQLPRSPLAGRAAWLVRTGSMKRPPPR